MLVIAICAAVYGNHRRASERQRKAFEQIAAKGGWVHWGTGGVSIGFGMPPWKRPNSFLCGTGLRAVYEPTHEEITFCDRDIRLLDGVIELRNIEFAGSHVTESAQSSFETSHKYCYVKR